MRYLHIKIWKLIDVSSKNKSTEVLSSMQYFFKIRSFSQSWRVSPLGAEIAYPSEAHQVYSGVLVPRLCVMFCRSLFVLFSVHCVVCFFSIYGFWLPLWYLRFTASDCPFGIFCQLCCMSFIDLRLLIAPLVSSNFSYTAFIFQCDKYYLKTAIKWQLCVQIFIIYYLCNFYS